MFLDLKPVNETKLLPRHLSYIIKQFRKGAAFLDDFIQALPGELAQKVEELMERQRKLSLDDMRELINLITDNRRALKAVKDCYTQDISEATRKMSFHLMKMVRFISLNCHADLAIVKTAKDYSVSKTLYIGVSKRPYCCCHYFSKQLKKTKYGFQHFYCYDSRQIVWQVEQN
ncbi:hypothetical protein BC833DRAFT_652731 [Globomyces pollinis-pini]|nr:hypothetical protein BC833DRAFT_652731 [Globomyces pollinis-pini]